MHCFLCTRTAGAQPPTFWSGCGRDQSAGSFSEHSGFRRRVSPARPSRISSWVYRLVRKSEKVAAGSRPSGEASQALGLSGAWSRATCWDRGIPWTELILRDQFLRDDLNLQLSQRVQHCPWFYLLLGLSVACAIYWGAGYFLDSLVRRLIFFFLLGPLLGSMARGPERRSRRRLATLAAGGNRSSGMGATRWRALFRRVVVGYALLFAPPSLRVGSEEKAIAPGGALVYGRLFINAIDSSFF